MKKTLMRGLSLLLCGTMMMGMTACGKKEESGAKKKDGDATEVVFWHSYSGATEEALKSIIDGYNEGRGKEKRSGKTKRGREKEKARGTFGIRKKAKRAGIK